MTMVLFAVVTFASEPVRPNYYNHVTVKVGEVTVIDQAYNSDVTFGYENIAGDIHIKGIDGEIILHTSTITSGENYKEYQVYKYKYFESVTKTPNSTIINVRYGGVPGKVILTNR